MLHKNGPVADPDEDLVPGRGRADLALGHGQGLRVLARRVRRHHRRGPRAASRSRRSARSRSSSSPRPSATTRPSGSSRAPTTSSPTRSAARRSTCSSRSSRRTGLTAICKVVIKDREALAALDPFGDTMLLTTLHWPDEIRSTGELDLPDEDFDVQARRARDGQAARLGDDRRVRPGQYKDEYREALETIIEAKVEGKETVEIEAARGERQAHRPDGRARGVGQRGQGRPSGRRPEPVSVADGEGRRRTAKAAAKAAKAPPRPRPPAADDEAEERRRSRPASARRLTTGRASPARARRRRPSGGTLPRDAPRGIPPQARLREDPGAGAGARHRRSARPGGSSSSATARRGSTTTSGSRSRASSSAGPSRRARPSIRRSGAWPSMSRTTRSSTSTSRASSRRSSTAPATSSSGTGGRGSPRRRPSTRARRSRTAS